jgi:catalase
MASARKHGNSATKAAKPTAEPTGNGDAERRRVVPPTSPRVNIAEHVGEGGELHQGADGGSALTTQQGVPVADDQNTLRVGDRGPAALEDFHFREKLFHFDHERIPERVVHARGYGAHGYFETYESLADLTRADIFQRSGERTPAFVRFSTVAGSKGSADLARDVRGFAVKLYTKEGNWDIVGNNMPVFFIQDAIKFPDFVHSVKPEPDRDFPQAQSAHDNFWDFVSLVPESTHMLMWVMSDRALPRSFRFMEGFGVHSFRFVDAAGQSTYVKFHWKPAQGLQSVTWDEAVKINGADPDFHRRDLWDAIQSGAFPEWELGVQVFDDGFADGFDFDILDASKLIPEELVPVRPVGRLVLNKMVDNFFAETEQVAFCTQNIVPGIDFTNDPLLQGRNFSYLDTQIKRLGGPNFTHLPVNAPKCPVAHFQQDGHMALVNPQGRVNYEPNSWPADQRGPREDAVSGFTSVAVAETGDKRRARPASFADHFSQAGQFFRSQLPIERRHIIDAFVFELSKVVRPDIRERMVANLRNVDEGLAKAIGSRLGLVDMPAATTPAAAPRADLAVSRKLSILANGPTSFAGRKLGVLVCDGANAPTWTALRKAFDAEGAAIEVIAPTITGVTLDDGTTLRANQMLSGGPSVLYDAVAIVVSAEGVEPLSAHPAARQFVTDAHEHCKVVGFVPAAQQLFDAAGLASRVDSGYVDISTRSGADAMLEACRAGRVWSRAGAEPVDTASATRSARVEETAAAGGGRARR